MKKKIAFALACAAFAVVVSLIDFEPIQSDGQAVSVPVPPQKKRGFSFASTQASD